MHVNLCQITHRNVYNIFADSAAALAWGLARGGHSVQWGYNRIRPGALNILFNANRLSDAELAALPGDVVIYNFEQLDNRDTGAFTPVYLETLARVGYLDYQQVNLDFMARKVGRPVGQWLPLGDAPTLRGRFEHRAEAEKDIDVLFFGSPNPRRRKVLAALEKSDLNLVARKAYGPDLEALLARTRLVLNLHYYPSGLLEVVRLQPLLANGIAVLTEVSPHTRLTGYEDWLDGLASAPYEALADQAIALVHDKAARTALSRKARRVIAARPMDRLVPRLSHAAAGKPWPLPDTLAFGAPQGFRFDRVNLHPDMRQTPDIAGEPGALTLPATVDAGRFGRCRLRPGQFRRILVGDVLADVPDLIATMAVCRDLLADGGEMEITVPHELSLAAWSGPQRKRVFNEHSFRPFGVDSWTIGWLDQHLRQQGLVFNLSDLGKRMKAEGADGETIARTPRAVDSLTVRLVKSAAFFPRHSRELDRILTRFQEQRRGGGNNSHE
ncbi:hypothetical protein [Yunchengibacter salinarum]|uniref:hypothetical protein n=1 Tax=Yunchengibacter salinarum TaxID=3133399 RepID=UPI0035B57255